MVLGRTSETAEQEENVGTYILDHLKDGGEWHPWEDDQFQTDEIVGSIIFGDDACDEVYVSVHGAGVYTTTIDGEPEWNPLGNVNGVLWARDMVIADQTLFVAGEFGIKYWQDGQWNDTGVPGDDVQPIMDLAVADPANLGGPVYAVRWQDDRIWRNADPGDNPGDWAAPAIDPLPDTAVRAVAGDENGVRFVGVQDALYRRVGNQWEHVVAQGARSFLISENVVYVGFTGEQGVYYSEDGGVSYATMNAGWEEGNMPSTVYTLLLLDDVLYAGTGSGVWRYR